MNKECAFCSATANLSGEHLWSDWMNELIPGKKRLTIRNKDRQIVKRWDAPKLDWKAKVVCEPCNNGWMSEIEGKHAKPAMSELILGKTNIPIDQTRANSIAIFAFKTAVIFDHISRDRAPFFDRSARHEFRQSLTIPPYIGMWLTKLSAFGKGEASTLYHEGRPSSDTSLKMYVCTYAVEHLVLQIVAYKERGIHRVSADDNFVAVPFWPDIPHNFVWPPAGVLNTVDDFKSFSDRWTKVSVTY